MFRSDISVRTSSRDAIAFAVRFSHPPVTAALAWIAVALSMFIRASPVSGMPASPDPIQLVQRDGTRITLYVRGDEIQQWFEDLDGFSAIRHRGRYVYARLRPDGNLAPTPFVVGRDNPQVRGLTRRARPTPQARARREAEFWGQDKGNANANANGKGAPNVAAQSAPAAVTASGTVKNLVVLCKFSDHVFNTHTREQADYDVLFNTIGGDATLAPTGSVRDCFLENSYGTMTLASTVVAWVTLPQTQAYYANGSHGIAVAYPQNAQGMVEDALDLVDPLVDFGSFDDDNDGFVDAISFVHSGYGAETGGGGGNWIWSHRWTLWALSGGQWASSDLNGNSVAVKVSDYHTEPALWGTSGTQISRIGVIVHETGHFFGLPDLYDTDGSSHGIGSWGMMANSWGIDGSQLYPPHFCAWSKISLGWVTPTVLTTSGSYSAPRVQTTSTIFKISSGFPSNEYLLIENRQAYGFDSLIPQGGLAIWHIDDSQSSNAAEGYPGQSGWPGNSNHYKVALLQADGSFHLEKKQNYGDSGDLFHAGGVDTLGPSTTPNTDTYQGGTITATDHTISAISASGTTMTFSFNQNSALAAITSPANASTLTSSSVTFTWSAGTGIDEYHLKLGTSVGGVDLYSRSQGTSTSVTVGLLPNDGSAVYARLSSRAGTVWEYNDYSYTAVTGADARAAMTSPADTATFVATSVTFTWSTGTGIDEYYLKLGTSVGGFDLYSRSQGTSTSVTVDFLPNDGSAVYGRLWSRAGTLWDYNDYLYTAVTGAAARAAMTSPADTATFASTSVTFTWSVGTGIDEYYLKLGTSVGGFDLYSRSQGTSTSATVNFLSNDGSAVYARLWSRAGTLWDYNDYSYTAVTSADPLAVMISPADTSTLGSTSVTFTWSTGTGIDEYYLKLGTSVGGADLYLRPQGTSTSAIVNYLPNDGFTVYARLWSRAGTVWGYNDYSYTAVTGADGHATMTSPADTSTLGSTSVTFNWAAGAAADGYTLRIGSTLGGTDLYASSVLTDLSQWVTGLPNDGRTLYVRLWTRTNGEWQFYDYTYTATS